MAEPKPRMSLEAYAELRARLSRDDVDRDAALADLGLDEETWDVIDDEWQAELSRALDTDGDDLPAAVIAYADAFARAQRDAPGRLLSLETFARCTRALRGARDPKRALEKQGVTLTEYLKANQHWSPQLATDDATRHKVRAAVKLGLTAFTLEWDGHVQAMTGERDYWRGVRPLSLRQPKPRLRAS